MTHILINCADCIADNHDACKHPEKCLCAVETNHNKKTWNVFDGVKVDFNKPIPEHFWTDWDELNRGGNE